MARAGVIVAVALLAALAGRLSAPGSEPPEGSARLPGPSAAVAGVGVGYPQTRAGAALAAAGYQQAFADTSILRPGVLRRRVEAVATPDFAATMLRANEPGVARLADGALGEGAREGIATAYFAVPIGYRLLSFSPSRAAVKTWGFTLIGNDSAIEPSAYFGTSRTELVWMGGDWKIADTRAWFGPTPRLARAPRSGEGFGVLAAIEELRPYGLAP